MADEGRLVHETKAKRRGTAITKREAGLDCVALGWARRGQTKLGRAIRL